MSDDLTMDSGALIFATLADVYLSSGMIEEAISILKDGLTRNPTYSLAKVILGRAYYIKGDIEQSLKILEGEYNELKDSESTNLYIGHCYRKLGEYEKAAEYYNLTLKINPDNTDAKQGLEAIGTGVKEAVVEKHEEIIPIPEPEKAKIVEQEAVHDVAKEPAVGVALPLDTHEPTTPERGQPETVEPEKVEMAAEPKAFEEVKEPEPKPVIEEKTEIEPAPVKQKEVEPAPSDEKIEPEPVAEPEPAKVEQVLQPGAAVDIQKTEHKEPRPVVQKESVVDLGLGATETKKVEEPEAFFPLEALDKPMKRLLNMKTVRGAFICSKDGLLIKNYYEECTDIEVISAMIAAIHNEAQEAFKYLKEGNVEKFIIDKIENPLCVITAGESLLTVVTQPEAKPGLVFVYARKIIEEIREILG
jgi:predicted regulator of Ras-like GTPase activity (Roadblock/LC7/MglB family)